MTQSCPQTAHGPARVFFDASVIWGLVGPRRIFGPLGNYYALNWFFLGGALCPVLVWALYKLFPAQTWIPLINLPILLGATANMPPATTLNYNAWVVVGTVFNFFVFRYRKKWWERYNYVLSAPLDAGVAFMGVVIFFALSVEIRKITYSTSFRCTNLSLMKIAYGEHAWSASVQEQQRSSIAAYDFALPTMEESGESISIMQKVDGRKKRVRRRKSAISYKMYIFKVLQRIHPSLQISEKAMRVMNSFAIDMFEKLAHEASTLARISKKSTITESDIETAVKLVLPVQVAKRAVSEGTKAVMKVRRA